MENIEWGTGIAEVYKESLVELIGTAEKSIKECEKSLETAIYAILELGALIEEAD